MLAPRLIFLYFLTFFILISCKDHSTKSELKTLDTKTAKKIVDLIHDFSRETIYWVTAKEFELDTVFAGQTDNGYYYTANNFTTAEHGGTHIDAPIHFAKGKQTVDQIPLENLMGPAIKIDVSDQTFNNPDYLVSIDDFKSWEAQENMQIPDGSIIVIYTGYESYYPDKKKYLGTDQRGEDAVKQLHFPGLSPEAATWLVTERHIKAIGLDTASIDYGQSTTFDSHVTLLSANIPAFENLTNLKDLPSRVFEIIALPMKIKGGSGGPLRIIALLDSN
ncbi:cyclase family protein [Mangrovimonas sp. AS39]|uniref:cyclase family protein n=1 Tax=Mangrovimonas futianensis TaxID=2895523 RepID=UPI001E591EA6|nr:cyclase family protein [Mangrovimonas futianensis]MCF1192213.1 cyclase family protein [Mangrovimonas futianensis]MCF1196038.1 cyclase family protein [Mangrovimonas futianensis]